MTRKNQIIRWASLTILGFYFLSLISVFTLLFPPKISAAVVTDLSQIDTSSIRFVDAQTIAIKVGGAEVALFKGAFRYSASNFVCPGGSNTFGESTLSILNSSVGAPAPNGSSNAILSVPLQQNGGTCNMTSLEVVISSADLSNSKIMWLDSAQLKAVVGFGGIGANETFTKKGTTFFRDNEKGQQCIDQAVVSANNVNVFELSSEAGGIRGDQVGQAGIPSTCRVVKINGVNVTSMAQARSLVDNPMTLAGQTNASKPPGSGDTGEDVNTCDVKFNSKISWIICPVVELGIGATDRIFSDFIQPLMEDVPVSTNSDDGAYKAWQQFRLIGNIVLVGAMIAVVYAQIKGS